MFLNARIGGRIRIDDDVVLTILDIEDRMFGFCSNARILFHPTPSNSAPPPLFA